MKKLKIISVILTAVCLCAFLSSCGSVLTVKDVRFTAVLVNPNGEMTLLCGAFGGDIKGTEDNPPTVLDAAIALLEENGIQYKTASDGKSITSISSKSETTRNGYSYVWVYEINGVEPKDKRAYEIEVQEGDVIVYYLKPELDESGIVSDDTDLIDGTDSVIEDTETVAG